MRPSSPFTSFPSGSFPLEGKRRPLARRPERASSASHSFAPRDPRAAHCENLGEPAMPASGAPSATFPTTSSSSSQCSRTCWDGAAAICRAASSSNSPSAARWSLRPKLPRPRRADGRHPALHHQGYRPRHPPSCATRAGIAVLLVEQYLDFCRELADEGAHHGARPASSIPGRPKASTGRKSGRT